MSPILDFLTAQQAEFRTARLPSLYADFRSQRTTNPDGYAANIAAWEAGLAAAAKTGLLPGGTLAIQFGAQLSRELQTRENGLPQALDAVVEEGVIAGHLVPLSDYLKSAKSIYNHSWDLSLSNAPLKLASWVMQQVGLVSKAAKDPDARYVLVKNIEDASTALDGVVIPQDRRTDRIIPKDEFRQKSAAAMGLETLSDSDLQILLVFLNRDRHLVAYNDKTVKIRSATESEPVLTVDDDNICSLKSLIANLTSQVASITDRIDQLQAKAKEAIGKKNKVSATAALRSKKLQEELLTKRTGTLVQLEGVYAKIEEAADQVEVVKAMKDSTQVLRSLSAETGGIENVEDILDNLHDEMSKVSEVGNVIGEQGSLAAGIDETAVDDELEQLEMEAQRDQERVDAEATQKKLQALNGDRVPKEITQSPETTGPQPQRVAENA